jgi:hypothetical protein
VGGNEKPDIASTYKKAIDTIRFCAVSANCTGFLQLYLIKKRRKLPGKKNGIQEMGNGRNFFTSAVFRFTEKPFCSGRWFCVLTVF